MKLSNESEDDHIGTASNENDTGLIDNVSIDIQDANETEVTTERETVLHESELTNDDNDATPSLNGKEQRETSNEILCNSSEATSYPTNEGEIIRQHKFYIHGIWLAVQSSYFRSLFFGGMKESSATEVHVQILESEEQTHLMLLEAMYKIDTLDNAGVDELLDVLKLAHKYDVKFVFKKAKYCLQAAVVSLDTCEKIMHFIKVDNTITDVDDLASTLQSFLAKEFSPLDKKWQTTSFKELCEPSVRYLLSSNELVPDSENTIFHALMHWIEQRGIESVLESEGMPPLLSVVRFELMSIDYLYNIVQHNAVAKKFADFHDHYLRGISYHALSNEIRQTLHNQPVKRKLQGCVFGTGVSIPCNSYIYTWVIPRDKLDTLVGIDKELKSDEFWYCGYRIVLTISHVQKVDGRRGNNKEMFSAKLSLEIINLKQHSVVVISWSAKSEANNCKSGDKRHTFKNGNRISSLDIRYGIEVQQQISSTPATGLFSSSIAPASSGFGTTTAFTFSSAVTAVQPTEPNITARFSFGNAPSTNTMETSTPASVANQEIPNTPCVSIDVKMNLV
ncbi:BTB POZ domain-containing POB1 [Paramuricea clavata]|uniref:BTB POZ domain-containing POB1 n=1 Tax=Paramuricea clavata TaxID=317549 RepID=A0A6S7KGZ6_PARCT|nr:BTB POZ domain-containing POB1 [Paramuricea clavata]